nr:hypothetical protein B0A51_00590 [Rachicladosporium sp. CCFEE 5018]
MPARTSTRVATATVCPPTHPDQSPDSEDDLATVAAISSAANRRQTLNTLKATKFHTAMRKTTTAKGATKRKTPAQALKDRTNLQGEETEVVEMAKKAPAAKRTRRAAENVIPETQADPVEEEGEGEISMEDAVLAPLAAVRQTSLQPRASARATSVTAGYPAPRDRSNSASGTERERRGGDPQLRRQLNDMTRKYENLSLKYQNLQALGSSNAETNFEKLKRASDEKARSAEALIESLRKEVAELKKAGKGSGVSAAEEKAVVKEREKAERLEKENAELRTRVAESSAEVKAHVNEVKALEAKVAAASAARAVPVNATEAMRDAKMKENLYADMTGLLIRNIKRRDEGDEYDCLQTGRNGTLHFHITIAPDGSATTTPGATQSHDDIEFEYEPMLDEGRDADLIEILPDYLAEAIQFPRFQAPRMYQKLIECMMKRVVVGE